MRNRPRAEREIDIRMRCARRFVQRHPCLVRQTVAFTEVAWRAGRDHVFPRRLAAPRARIDMIERQSCATTTVLAGIAVAGEQRTPRDAPRRKARHLDVGNQPDHDRMRQRGRRRADHALRMGLEHDGFLGQDEATRSPHTRHVERFVRRVQDEHTASNHTPRVAPTSRHSPERDR